jgi:2-iminobutanoate/2-iminopropanoate deaminase
MSIPHPIEKQIVKSALAPDWDDPISPATAWRNLVFCSGELGADPATLQAAADDVASQARQCLRNLEATLAAVGSSLEHVLKVTAYLNDPEDYDAWNAVFAEEFPSRPPARTTIGVHLIGDYKIEIELVAYVPGTT